MMSWSGYPTEHADDFAIMKVAIRGSPTALRWASRRLKRDSDLVRMAVHRGGTEALLFAAESLHKRFRQLADQVDDLLSGMQ